MTVGFFHSGDSLGCAPHLVASVRAVMPDVRIVQWTQPSSAVVPGVDVVAPVVPDGVPLALAVLQAFATAEAGEWLLVDTDVTVERDIRHVFSERFDLAVADRLGTLRPHEVGTKFMARMPYNKGAVYSRCPEFWRRALDVATRYKPGLQDWMGDQQAVNDVIATGQFNVKVLPSAYNYAPHRKGEDLSATAVVHWKGTRKLWLSERAS